MAGGGLMRERCLAGEGDIAGRGKRTLVQLASDLDNDLLGILSTIRGTVGENDEVQGLRPGVTLCKIGRAHV